MTQSAKGDGAFLILRVEAEVPAELEAAIANSLEADCFQLVLD